MYRINFTQKGSIIETTKAKRIAILPFKVINNTIEGRKREFVWFPKSAIVQITDFYIIVFDYIIDFNSEIKRIMQENADLQIIEKIN